MPSEIWSILCVAVLSDVVRWFAYGSTAEGRTRRERFFNKRIALTEMRTWLLVVAFVFMAALSVLLAAARTEELRSAQPQEGFTKGLLIFMMMSAVLTFVFLRALVIRVWRANRAQRDASVMGRT